MSAGFRGRKSGLELVAGWLSLRRPRRYTLPHYRLRRGLMFRVHGRIALVGFRRAADAGRRTGRHGPNESSVPSGRRSHWTRSSPATYQWRAIGPDKGGRSIGVSGVKGRPQEAYFGAVGGGLWKTTNGGNDWLPVTDGQIGSTSVGAVAVSESNPDVVYIGTGETCIRGNIIPGDGVYKSTDAGKTWTKVGFSDKQNISKIRIHPTNPDIVVGRRVRVPRRT